MQAAYTKKDTIYPGYVNATREGEHVTVTVRGDARDGNVGPMASLKLTFGEWRQFLSEVEHRL